MAAAASSEGARARPAFTFEDTYRMLGAKCSLEAFQERMLSSEFDVARDGQRVYWNAPAYESRPIRAWLRSLDFAARVGAIEWENPLGVFFDACMEGDEEYVSRLSEEHPEWLDKGCKHTGAKVLHAVCHGGLMRLVPDLVSRFGDVDVRDWYDRTPLNRACWGGQLAVFEYLVSVGADVRAVSRYGETMLDAACHGGNLAIVRALLDMGLDVNAQNVVHRTPLHQACEYAGLDVVSMLVEHGAELHPVGGAPGDTPLHRAVRRGDLSIVRYLHEHSAELEVADLFSPLCNALQHARMDVVEYLVSVGASVESVREHWERVVSGIMIRDSVSAMEWLLSRGVVSVSMELIDRCLLLNWGRYPPRMLRCLLLHEWSVPLLSRVDESRLPDGFLGGCASLSKWREHELRMDLRYLMLSWRRGFVVSRLEG
jgi:ankyrin repeat protein